ncbi:AAA family ATPase, partial [Oleiphilus sp. HI0066]|uniref:AAA family ATPase n=2 Tax=Oleiphilus TaxID=141450 RepID=UPI000AB40BC4
MYDGNHEPIPSYEGYPELDQQVRYENPFRSVCVNDFMAENIPPRQCILAPWLPEQGLAMIYAPRGIGKTFFSLNIAHAVATGTSFLGWEVKQPTP